MLDTQKPKRTVKRLTPEQIRDIKSAVRLGMKPAEIAELVGTNIKNVYNWKAKTRPERKKVDTVAASLERAADLAAKAGIALKTPDAFLAERFAAATARGRALQPYSAEFAELKAENEKLRKLVVDLALQVVGR